VPACLTRRLASSWPPAECSPGGPSAGYCQELAQNANDAILLTGYQDEESPGRALLDLARCEGPKQLRLGQATVPVACLFGTYGLSAHAGLLQANGYELLDQRGPSHQPTFTTIAWATLSDGRTIRSEPISGSSKKSGQRAAAGRLLDLLVQEGITGRGWPSPVASLETKFYPCRHVGRDRDAGAAWEHRHDFRP